jgi:Fe-S-cluster-containing dehydrogenase component/DMSO reductase anchor subunit
MATAESTTWLVDALLNDQQQLTAVDHFAQQYEHESEPLQAEHYRSLIPLTQPEAGQQYAFEVDLDSCSGCKACVAACHNLNGLEDEELWRNVGLLIGGTSESPALQHVTTACHHCIEPACLIGCPVDAYHKDPLTGIVRHLDDQCIGCQYCMLKCPYDVPRYSKSKGIVRKCDMCRDRLSASEAPACVQSCPNQAIRIQIVEQDSIIEECEAQQFLASAPEPGYTLPTTVYKSSRPLPRNLLPEDYYSAIPRHGHWALVIMLVLTQMSVGAFVVQQLLLRGPWMRHDNLDTLTPLYAVTALGLGFLGLAASIFHLGRPMYAFRAWLGLRTSWLSREIVAFGVFAALATAYAALAWFGEPLSPEWQLVDTLAAATALVGVAAIGCSVMIYVDTRRPFWTLERTTSRFLLTALILGLPLALLISFLAAGYSDTLTLREVMLTYGWSICRWLAIVTSIKLVTEAWIFWRLNDRQFTPLRRTARLMSTDLSMATLRRFLFGAIGGLLLPLMVLSEQGVAPDKGYEPMFLAAVVTLMFAILLAGELTERYLFFAASAAPKMPGSPA